MYADKQEAERPLSKRQRDGDKWEHDLFDRDGPQISNRRVVGSHDLRSKLQSKSIHHDQQHGSQIVKGSISRGVRDLREKLSGLNARPIDMEPPRRKQKILTEVSKPFRKSFIGEAPVSETRRVASSVSKKITQKKGETVDNFLESLGLAKYCITFQAEEVDMTALTHMNDEDLKAIGIPMGPRKKITIALESKV